MISTDKLRRGTSCERTSTHTCTVRENVHLHVLSQNGITDMNDTGGDYWKYVK